MISRPTIIASKNFMRRWKALGLTDEDMIFLENTLYEDPTQGDPIVGGNGLRKMRIAFPNRGKSGSGRICYLDLFTDGKIYLYRIYAKNEQENISQKELNELAKDIEELKHNIRKGR